MRLVKVAVACVNQTPFAWDENFAHLRHAVDFFDHVFRALETRGIEPALGGFELRQRDLNQQRCPKDFCGFHTLAVTRRIESIDERVLRVRIEDPEMCIRGQRYGFKHRSTAIDEHKMILFAKARHALIENAARHADKFVLRFAAKFREPECIHFDVKHFF